MKSNYLRSTVFFFSLFFLFCIVNVTLVNAQGKDVLIKGSVEKSNGEPISGVSVVIRNIKTNFSSGTTTDSAGIFTFSRIPAGGPYSFTFTSIGYLTQSLSGYNIKEDFTLSLVVKMIETTTS